MLFRSPQTASPPATIEVDGRERQGGEINSQSGTVTVWNRCKKPVSLVVRWRDNDWNWHVTGGFLLAPEQALQLVDHKTGYPIRHYSFDFYYFGELRDGPKISGNYIFNAFGEKLSFKKATSDSMTLTDELSHLLRLCATFMDDMPNPQ